MVVDVDLMMTRFGSIYIANIKNVQKHTLQQVT